MMLKQFFQSLTHRRQIDLTKDMPNDAFASLTFTDISALIKTLRPNKSASVRSLQAISQRLLQLAYLDESLSKPERKLALTLEQGIYADVERGLQGNAEALESSAAVRSFLIDYARKMGVFSLAHKLSKLDKNQVVDEMLKPENSPLLNDFPRQIAEPVRTQLVVELIRSRQPPPEKVPLGDSDIGAWTVATMMRGLKHSNGVIVAAWLILTDDATAVWLFTADERVRLARFLDDYDSAKQILVDLNAIDAKPPLALHPAPDPQTLAHLIWRSCLEDDEDAIDRRIGNIPHDLLPANDPALAAFQWLLRCFRWFIWKRLLLSTYGSAYLQQTIVAADAGWPTKLDAAYSSIESCYENCVSGNDGRNGLHVSLVAWCVMDSLNPERPESERLIVLNTFADILSKEILYFPQFARSLMRIVVHGEDHIVEVQIEDPIPPSR